MHPKIISTQAATDQSGVKCGIYGKPGTGKTRLSLSVPSPLILSAERGLLSIRDSGIPVWPINQMSDLIEAYNYLSGSAEARNFHTIVVDSASDCAEVLLSHEKKINVDKKNGFKPYNELNEQFMNLLRCFRSLQQKHVYFIFKEEYDKDENGMMMFQPSMPGKQLTMQIPYLLDEIFRLIEYNDPQYGKLPALQCQSTPTAIAKDRSGKLQPYEPYDLGAIIRKIMS